MGATGKDLKKLNRAELLALLIEQKRENERLEAELAEVRAQLEDKRIVSEKAGSIAEAALLLNGVFEAAEAACLQYVDSVCRQYDEVLASEQERARRMLEAAENVKRDFLS